MARSDTRTWLPLDTWARIFGFDPFHFNGILIGLNPPDPACNDVWCQYGYQNGLSVSREDIAIAIADAESQIASYVGYNLMPDWDRNERHRTEKFYRRDTWSTGVNVRGQPKSIKLRKGYLLNGGHQVKSVINPAAPIVREDRNGDGYEETAVVTVTTAAQDPNEIRVYFPGESDDTWEIRPIKVTATGTQLVIEFPIYLVPRPEFWEGYDCMTGIDGDDPNSFVNTVAVYRVYTDPNGAARMLWEADNNNCACGTCSSCCYRQQTACLQVRDERIGTAAYIPDGQTFNRDPDQLIVDYYSGWRYTKSHRPCQDLDPYWARAIAYFSVGLLRREICGCCTQENFILRWYADRAEIPEEGSSYRDPNEILMNPFGTTEGAIEAWRRANADGRKLGGRWWS